MMHGAQIRAIIPITVQIIVRELVAAKRVASAETQPKRPARLRSATTRVRVDTGRREGWVEANFGRDFGARNCQGEGGGAGISKPAFRLGNCVSIASEVAVSPRRDLDVLDTGDDNGIVAIALTAASLRLCPPRHRH